MTPEQQNIAVAEACGWRKGPVTGRWIHSSNEGMKHYSSAWVNACNLPSCHSDLNACAEFERMLSLHEGDKYALEVYRVVTEARARSKTEFRAAGLLTISATAPQRCEAFLRTLNLWKEQP